MSAEAVEAHLQSDSREASTVAQLHALQFSDMQDDLTALSELVSTQYAYRHEPRQPWNTWGHRYNQNLTNCASFSGFASIVAAALDELRDLHAEVRTDYDARWLPVPTFTDFWAELDKADSALITAILEGSDADSGKVKVGDRVVQVDGRSLRSALESRLGESTENVTSRELIWALMTCLTGRSKRLRRYVVQTMQGDEIKWELPAQRSTGVQFNSPLISHFSSCGIGVIRLNNSLGDQATVTAFDEVLDKFRSAPGLILDLRFVPSGGVSSVALGLMGRLISRRTGYQRHEISDYGQTGVVRSWVEEVSPRGTFQYQGPMVVLVNRWTGSMGEGIAIGLDAMRRALVVGTAMAGLAGATRSFSLPYSGLNVSFPCERLSHLNGTPRENWIPATIRVDGKRSGKDELLAAAEGLIQIMCASGTAEQIRSDFQIFNGQLEERMPCRPNLLTQ